MLARSILRNASKFNLTTLHQYHQCHFKIPHSKNLQFGPVARWRRGRCDTQGIQGISKQLNFLSGWQRLHLRGKKKLPYCTHGWWRTKTKEKYGKMQCMLIACSYMPIQRLYLSLFSTHLQPCVNSLYQYKARILNQVPLLQWHSHSPTSEQILPKNWPDEFVTTVTTIIPAEQKEGYWKKRIWNDGTTNVPSS